MRRPRRLLDDATERVACEGLSPRVETPSFANHPHVSFERRVRNGEAESRLATMSNGRPMRCESNRDTARGREWECGRPMVGGNDLLSEITEPRVRWRIGAGVEASGD